jgi:N-acetylmuramoyl-L-alanine amidase
MGKYYYIQQGDHLAKVARENGFADFNTIWDAAENKDLKEKRKNPNILFPGDKVFIPEKETKEESRATEKKHRFELHGDPLKLRVVLMGLKNKPLEGHQCTFTVETDTEEITTKSDGLLKKEISETAQTGKLVDRGKPGDKFGTEREIPLKIGHLDPADEISGQVARLNNLGYLAGDPTVPLGKSQEEEDRYRQFQSAIEEFQCDFGLKVDGICGKQTQDKLIKAHGC